MALSGKANFKVWKSIFEYFAYFNSIFLPILQAHSSLDFSVRPLTKQLSGEFVQICPKK